MNITDDLTEYLTASLRKRGKLIAIDPHTSLIEAGVLDSLSLLDLVNYAEKRFGVKIPGDDIVPEHFGTLATIAQYLGRRIEEETVR